MPALGTSIKYKQNKYIYETQTLSAFTSGNLIVGQCCHVMLPCFIYDISNKPSDFLFCDCISQSYSQAQEPSVSGW